MQYVNLLNEEKRKISNLIKHEYMPLDFSNLKLILDNNSCEPLWMDIYILIYKAKLPPAVSLFDILLEKLSKPSMKFYYKNDGERYIADANENMVSRYVRYLITKEKVQYQTDVQYIPSKDYIKELLKYRKFEECGMYLKHEQKDKFCIEPIQYKISNVDDAKNIYENVFEGYDLYKNLKLDKNNLLDNFETAIKLSRDRKMIATLSTILSYFGCKFSIESSYITIAGTKVQIEDERTANGFQEHLLDTYQFYRNVVNTTDKKDMISEVYNRKVLPGVIEQFNDNISKYLNVVENKELIDWIITISKESKYTLDITFDDQGIFYIEKEVIITPTEAREFYISYMDNKKEKLAMMIYSNTILGKIKKVWNMFKAKLAKR